MVALLKEKFLEKRECNIKSLKRQGFDAYGIELKNDNEINSFIENDYDLAYLALHGGNGENGKFQAVLDILEKNTQVQGY